MSNRTPSLLALLGLAAVAGYQNRDTLKRFVDKTLNPDARPNSLGQQSDYSVAGQSSAHAIFDGDLVGSLRSGLSDLVARFRQSGDEKTAQSWVGTGQNVAVTPDQLRSVLGAHTLADLTAKTGLTEVNLLSRLSQVLPEMVDTMTQDGAISLLEPRGNPMS